jgi:hypothetical protein
LLDEFSVVGVTERFDETLVAFGHQLGWPPASYEWANRSPQRLRRAELAPGILDELHERNAFDLRLHQCAHEHLDAYLSGFDAARALRLLTAATRAEQRRVYVRDQLHRAKVIASRAKQAVKRLAR